MLKTLIVQNYSLIKELHIDFQSGFSTITGETGAGKSIMLGALGLLLGQRADSKSIRSGAGKCVIEGQFSLSSEKLKDFFLQNDFEFEQSDCIIRREISASGKSRVFINDTPAQLSQLKELGEHLIDIHSQHKNLLLNREDFQLEVLDIIARNEALLDDYKKNYSLFKDIKSRLRLACEEAKRSKEEEDFLNFQFTQLEEAHLLPEEQEQLEEELDILSHAEDIKQALYGGTHILQDSENSVLSQLRSCQGLLRSIQNVYSPAQEWIERLDSTLIELKDISCDLENSCEEVEFNPSRLDFVNERLNTIYSLQKKHGKNSVTELLELQEELQQKLDLINNSEEYIHELESQLENQQGKLQKLAAQLTKERKKSAKIVIDKMVATLSNLGMPNIQFEIELTQATDFKTNGQDEVRYLFNANKGGSLQELSQIASGGEIARVMLSLKSMMAGAADLPTLIFDEIDTGVSGSIAEKMAIIMSEMCQTEDRQVISITHLPQIAAKGHVQYKVYKEDLNNVTESHIVQLTTDERIQEIAHMLSGEHLTDAALENAKELLKLN